MRKQIITLIIIAVFVIMAVCAENAKSQQTKVSSTGSGGQTTSVASSSQKIKEMHPKYGRSLEFSEKDEAEYNKILEALNKNEWNYDKLTAKQNEFLKKVGGLDETKSSLWNTIGDGCSWYCGGGPSDITASSYLKSNHATINYVPKNIHDFSLKTAWVEGVEGQGIGEYVTYHFSSTAARVTHVIIANGCVVSERLYRANSRVKKLKMYVDGKPFAILNLKDVRKEQIFKFDPIGRMHNNDWTMKFEILEVYPGDKYEDTVITEIYFDGIDVH